MAEREQEIRARLEAATPGPWRIRALHRRDVTGYLIEGPNREDIARLSGGLIPQSQTDAHAEIIANAPADLAYLLELAAAEHRVGDGFLADLNKAQADLNKGQADLAVARAEVEEAQRIARQYVEGFTERGAYLLAERAEVERLREMSSELTGRVTQWSGAHAGALRELEVSDRERDVLLTDLDQARDLAAAAAEEAARLREALEQFGEHHGSCMQVDRRRWQEAGRPEPVPCTCGYEAALTREDGDG